MRASTIPAAVKEAASANLSTLATTTCFRTADGEFHGFEGSDDTSDAASATARTCGTMRPRRRSCSPRLPDRCGEASFGFSMDDAGAMHFRQMLPDGKARWGFAAADGQMGQIIHAWIDWKISGTMRAASQHLAAREEGDWSLRGFREDGMPTATA